MGTIVQSGGPLPPSRVPGSGVPLASTPVAFVRASGVPWGAWIEAASVIAVILAILPWFTRVATLEGRQQRYASSPLAMAAWPAPLLPRACRTTPDADPELRTALCRHIEGDPGDHRPWAASLAAAQHAIAAAFASSPDAGTVGRDGPAPVACAIAALTSGGASGPSAGVRHANARLVLAAAIDGVPAATGFARRVALPERAARVPACADLGPREALAQAAALMAEARAAKAQAAKNDAMHVVLATAGWQWAGAMLLSLALLRLGRTGVPPFAGAGLALVAWAAAAWGAQVSWGLARQEPVLLGGVLPAALPLQPFVIGVAALGLALVVIGLAVARPHAAQARTPASPLALPGFVAATGIGWVVLLDLSANGPPSNRYLGLYHQGHLWLALVALTVAAFLRPALGRVLGFLLAIADEIGGRLGRVLGGWRAMLALALVVVALVAATGALLSGARQVTSELGRVWLIVGTAWFFFLRGGPAAERLAREGTGLPSLLRYAWPLAFVALVLAGAMVVTRDMGPLLIASYAAGAFLAASVAMWWHVRNASVVVPGLVAVVLFIAWIVGLTQALFAFGTIDAVTAERLENLATPLASANDQNALVTWFRQATPPGGFGVGAVPWCGFGATAGCAGVPAQIQSDYTFTALVGLFGNASAWGITIAVALWLHALVRGHGRVTRGEPRLVRVGPRVMHDRQALLSWIAVTWVVLTTCQLAVTVAGNLAVLPLTGVTFPFVSFGMTSLVVNSAMLGLAVTVDAAGGRDA